MRKENDDGFLRNGVEVEFGRKWGRDDERTCVCDSFLGEGKV